MAEIVRALGAMSGTSLDGVDAAVVVTDGERILDFGPTAYRPYTEAEREVLRAALGHWEGKAVERAARVVEDAHAEVLGGFEGVDLVGFHGQTLAHDPRGRGTHQAGDGERLAERLGLPVVWDFRSEDVAQGGEGAPLAPFYHFALTRRMGVAEPVAFLNLGGVGNVTWVDPSRARPEEPGALLAFDTGPANAPIDDLLRSRRGLSCDEDGRLAAQGRADAAVLEAFLSHPYLVRRAPKSLDRDDFAWLLRAVAPLPDADAAATLVACAAAGVARGLALCSEPPRRLLVGGGGRRNPTLMARIAEATGLTPEPVEAARLDGDMLEAQAFAYLAVRVSRGWPTSSPDSTGASRDVNGGKLATPRVQRSHVNPGRSVRAGRMPQGPVSSSQTAPVGSEAGRGALDDSHAKG